VIILVVLISLPVITKIKHAPTLVHFMMHYSHLHRSSFHEVSKN